MKTKGVMVLNLTEEEKRAFAIVDNILKTIQEQGEEYRVMSLETGECVDFSEIARVRGVVGCFANGGEYEVTRVGKKCECYEEEEDSAYEDECEEEALVNYLLNKIFGIEG